MFDVECLFFRVQDSEVVGSVQTRRGVTEFQDVYDHVGCTFTLLGDSDRAGGNLRFCQILAGLGSRSTKERQP